MTRVLRIADWSSRRQLRVRVTLLAGLEYVSTCLFLAVYWRLGKIDGRLVFGFLAYSIVVNLLFLTAIASGLSERLRDPSMTAIQMTVSCGRDLLGCALLPGLWYLFAFNLFIALPFGSLQFTNRAFAVFWLLTCVGLGMIFSAYPGRLEIGFDTPAEKLVLWLFLSAALARLMIFNSRISALRRKLRARGLELAQSSRQMERERIARDLHDTLLQSIYGLVWRFSAVARTFPAEHPAAASISSAVIDAERVLTESRNEVLGLRRSGDVDQSLAQTLKRCALQCAEDTGLAFHFEPPQDAPALAEDMRVSLERILLEALGNAFRHSSGRNVWLELEFRAEVLRASVRDDGQGIPSTFLCEGKSGHFGIAVMRERAASIRASLVVRTDEGGGTQVTVQVPGRLAYKAVSAPAARWMDKCRVLGKLTGRAGSDARS